MPGSIFRWAARRGATIPLKEDKTVSAILNPNRDQERRLRGPLRQGSPGRVLAIDLGDRRMGLAVSDPLGLTAQGLPTAERRNKRQDLTFLEVLTRRHRVSRILVGNPLNMDGSAGPQSAKARAFADELARRLQVAVEMWDERLTSVESHRALDETGVGKEDRKGTVDRMAASLLLQSFLDARRAQPPAGEAAP